MNASTKQAPVLAESLADVLDSVRQMQTEKKTRNDILIHLNKMIHNPELFATKQRAIVVREVNKKFNLNVTMSEIKRAIRAVNTAKPEPKKPEKAIPVNALSGISTLKLENGNSSNSEPAVTTATANTSSTTQESNTMPPINEVFTAVRAKLNTDAPLDHNQKVDSLKAVLKDLGAETEEAIRDLVDRFVKANPDHLQAWNLLQTQQAGPNGILDQLVAYLDQNEQALGAFHMFTQAKPDTSAAAPGFTLPGNATTAPEAVTASAPAAGNTAEQPAATIAVSASLAAPAASLTDRVLTSLRGDRKTGFSSGVVAAAAAVVGGGLEMAFKGRISVGSTVGTAAGATGAFFLGNATDKLMDTDTGRYLLAGAIGVVAGGVGSRVGGYVQSEYVSPGAAIDAAIETVTGHPAPQTVPVTSNTEALSALLGL